MDELSFLLLKYILMKILNSLLQTIHFQNISDGSAINLHFGFLQFSIFVFIFKYISFEHNIHFIFGFITLGQ